MQAVRTQLTEAQARLARPTRDATTDEDSKHAVEQAQDALNTLLRKKPYTHCELDRSAILGISAFIIPLPEKAPGPRNTFQCSMGKQALGIYHSNYMNRFDTTVKTLAFPSRPLVP